jgi:hypothetical protein
MYHHLAVLLSVNRHQMVENALTTNIENTQHRSGFPRAFSLLGIRNMRFLGLRYYLASGPCTLANSGSHRTLRMPIRSTRSCIYPLSVSADRSEPRL